MNHVPETMTPWPGHTGNWGKWPNDRGSLNYITPEATLRGVQAVRQGRAIPCARPITMVDPNDPSHKPAIHTMYPMMDGKLFNGSFDELTFHIHSMLNTHIDAFSHVGVGGYAFHGRPFNETVNMEEGAVHCDITDMLNIVSRGIFLDVARNRGVDGLRPGEYVTPEDLAPLLERAQPGDIAVVRTGITLTGGNVDEKDEFGNPKRHYSISGFHADCIPLLAEKGISVLASDSPSDTYPCPVEGLDGPHDSPVHGLCLALYGIPLCHNMDLEEVGRICAETGQQDFLFMVAALHLRRGTGSPCTPLAVL